MLAKINKIKPWQAAIVIAVIGIAVFFTGLTSPFQGDDQLQIVDNVPAHSISNIRLFFEGGTGYNGQGLAPLTGIYYRPLMTTVFSAIYSVFGPHTIAFHILQLFIYIGSAVLLYLIFKYIFTTALALFLSLVFLVHPLNSQVVYAIPSMQDVLFFFFGILALYLLIKLKTKKSLLIVGASIFTSMLSKEMGMTFILISLLYLCWFDRKRLYAFLGIIILPIIAYFALKINAVGLYAHSNIAPIDKLDFVGRMMNVPSMLLFYISKFVFPWKLASGYYWVHSSFSYRYVLLPLVIDILAAGLFIYMGVIVKRKLDKAQYYMYLFFGIWAAIGIIPYLQAIPLDMTVCETWFYFSMAGLLGMVGIILTAVPINAKPNLLLIIAIILVGSLGLRTAIRGLDWENTTKLSYKDIVASPDDFDAYVNLAVAMNDQGNFNQGGKYALTSVNIYPSDTNYNELGVALFGAGDYADAQLAFNSGTKYGKNVTLYENMARLTLYYGTPASDSRFYTTALGFFPNDSQLWMYLAILDDGYGHNGEAKTYIDKAASYGQVPQFIYNGIANNTSYTIRISDIPTILKVQ